VLLVVAFWLDPGTELVVELPWVEVELFELPWPEVELFVVPAKLPWSEVELFASLGGVVGASAAGALGGSDCVDSGVVSAVAGLGREAVGE